ncbi:uncharacterized protein MELLADRAFT_88946 [Melampsora larici-populina 98AG31]|uniref:Pre-mRNA-splicing factor Syf1/CRNKL1-like C-terminal HAT-repeats domain-containing protein n=1 Tax=Melampsora larici-populina (strain 98AG31 / pathotype 3-4-7) TaxID=747676 RepID=F4R6D5_MELLP|nr:uncharacterized protein MELLADRAFT_88946 [Melampsora larici-populina 98AG31]EGG12480.1 hypothetical protein MELLADRAFT_88946 [Melampsora larici-populina 98AG31]
MQRATMIPENQLDRATTRVALTERFDSSAIYTHASQFCDPRTAPEFWQTYLTLEIQHGSEDAFREVS